MQHTALIIFTGVLLRWCVSLYPYSGAGKPPMYGDYEAQRHWQEITVNLPVREWYVNSSNNDLLYWGLDYPPLTAYHSYLCGMVARRLDPAYVELHVSRGYESASHKLFMRYTVLVADLLVYLPAAYCLLWALGSVSGRRSGGSLEYLALVLYPGLYLVDYGHFQYNNASLGLFVGTVAALVKGQDCLGSILFCLALNYKQMELYHALPIFFYLLGVCCRQRGIIGFFVKLAKLGVSVILTFILIWYPFMSDAKDFVQVVHRLFPIGRGLYEDKVASVWCSLSVLVKLRQLVDNTNMALICLLSTVVCMIPSSLQLFARATVDHLRYALINGSMVFFLFSYHVHEKSILLVAIPACMVIGEETFVVTWFLLASVVSMLPLLVKDGLAVPALALTLLFWIILHVITSQRNKSPSKSPFWVWMRRSFHLSLAGFAFLSLALLTFPTIPRYPDLYPVLLSLYSCGHFSGFCLYFHYCQFTLNRHSSVTSAKVKTR